MGRIRPGEMLPGYPGLSFNFNGMNRPPTPHRRLRFVYRISPAWHGAAWRCRRQWHRLLARATHIL